MSVTHIAATGMRGTKASLSLASAKANKSDGDHCCESAVSNCGESRL